jgi:Gametolysin peptidase M11/NPCBM-associated, NEW3 domain of alpha-galactosidase
MHRVVFILSRAVRSLAALMLFCGLLSGPAMAAPPEKSQAAPTAPAAAAVAEGILEILVEDHPQFSRTRHFLKTDTGRLELQFKSKAPQLRSGARLRVRGSQTGTVMALSTSDSASLSVLASAPLANTFGEQKVAVLLVNFIDDTSQPYTVAQANDVVFSQTSGFIKENSFQQTWLTGNTFGWYTLPIAKTCNGFDIGSYARLAAASAGVDLTPYGKVVYVFPFNASCGWAGQASLGGATSSVWVNGHLELRVVGHEIGHTFGLYHSHALECGATTLGSACTSIEYGDTVDIMGNNAAGHFDSFHKERLGWLNNGAQPPITTVQTSGSYSIDSYAAAGTKPKALKILKSIDPVTGANTWYYIEYRQATGYDTVLSGIYGTNVLSGVVIRTGTDADGNTSSLLDMTPNSSFYTDWFDPALSFGQSFSDPASGVMIVPTSGNGTSAQIDVSLNQPAGCTRARPTLAVSGGGQAVAAGTSVSYGVTVTNNDSSACGGSNFALQASVPSGWTTTLGAGSLLVNPGASALTTLSVTSTATASVSTYAVGASAINSAASQYAAAGSASYVVAAAISTSISTSQATYKRGDTVSATAKVLSGTSPMANVNVSFLFTKPNGSTVVTTALTDSGGLARADYRVSRKDPVGTWQVKDTASYGGLSASGTIGFAVQ